MPIADEFPIIPHERVGVDCCGCVVPVDYGADYIQLRCNECGAAVGTIRTSILRDLVALINWRG
jgi:hypothetical protein